MDGLGPMRRIDRASGGHGKRLAAATSFCSLLIAAAFLVGCASPTVETVTAVSPPRETPAPASPIWETPTPDNHILDALSPVSQTLASLERVDDHPLYVMQFYGDYGANAQFSEPVPPVACSLFAALGDPDDPLYGRNFDWEPSAAVLLYTDPTDGYASISMVNLGFLGYGPDEARDLLSLSEAELAPLLRAPFLPIDGMNEAGLAVGMAAVPESEDRTDPSCPSISSLGIMRAMLDDAATVDEAIAVMEQYTILFDGGPPVHYLMADATGMAVLVEFGSGQRQVIPSDQPWHVATNFLVEPVRDDARSYCTRYRTIDEELEAAEGRISSSEAMSLLQTVSGEGTQWSAVYEISSRALHVVMGRQYDAIHTFRLERVDP